MEGWGAGPADASRSAKIATAAAAALATPTFSRPRSTRKLIGDAGVVTDAQRDKNSVVEEELVDADQKLEASDKADDLLLAALEEQERFDDESSMRMKKTKRRPLRVNSKFDLTGGDNEQTNGNKDKCVEVDNTIADLSFKLRELDLSEESEGKQDHFGFGDAATEVSGDIEVLAR